jgi:hypothetical protein
MKKSLLATAISAAAIASTGVYALPNTVEMELWVANAGVNVVTGCPAPLPTPVSPQPPFTGGVFTVAGNAPAATMTGELCLDPAYPGAGLPVGAPYVALDFQLNGAAFGAVGTVFDSGTVDIWTEWGSGWSYYNTIDASNDPIPCLIAGGVGGITWNTATTPDTPLFTGGLMAGGNVRACEANLLGMPARIFMQ